MKNRLLLCASALVFMLVSCNETPKATPVAAQTESPKPTGTIQRADVSPLLQGKWQSVDDPKNVFEIAGNDLFQTFDGKKMVKRVFQYSKDCSGNACNGGVSMMGCYTSAGEMDIDCYKLISISTSEMETSQIGVEAKPLKYKKIN